MFTVPSNWIENSTRLSQVIKVVGVNKFIVLQRRRAMLMQETIRIIHKRLIGSEQNLIYFGSQTEGTTTVGLDSDRDIVSYEKPSIVVCDYQKWWWNNFLMIQPEDTPPGYCMLQLWNPICGNRRPVVLQNEYMHRSIPSYRERKGPSWASKNDMQTDLVPALHGEFLPNEVISWLDQKYIRGELTEEIKHYIESNGCLFVAVGSEGSSSANLEWRISTSYAERCIMFSLNITQIQCYVLMKMIVKTHLCPKEEKIITSFMCKNILLLCISRTPHNIWKQSNILACLCRYLLELFWCIKDKQCPHFIIHKNNLFRGKLTNATQSRLLSQIQDLMENIYVKLQEISIDVVGNLLRGVLNVIDIGHSLYSKTELDVLSISGKLLFLTGFNVNRFYHTVLTWVPQTEGTMVCMLLKLSNMHRIGSELEKAAIQLIVPPICSVLGSMIASRFLDNKTWYPRFAENLLSMGQKSDVSSGRLKFASVLCCKNDFQQAESILNQAKELYDETLVQPVCCCYVIGFDRQTRGFLEESSVSNEQAVRHNIAFCVKFLPNERHCVPREFQYEMFRCSAWDMLERIRCQRCFDDYWMEWAVVDSLPYLYFLQYKIYSYLGKHNEQQTALNNLAVTLNEAVNLRHKETGYNLLGQCMKQENRFTNAFVFYFRSLNIRPRNNAAVIHICVLLNKMILRGGAESSLK